MSSCFFSSREKMRISAMSVLRKRLRTALPKLPVPPVIISVFPAKMLIIVYLLLFVSNQMGQDALKPLTPLRVPCPGPRTSSSGSCIRGRFPSSRGRWPCRRRCGRLRGGAARCGMPCRSRIRGPSPPLSSGWSSGWCPPCR